MNPRCKTDLESRLYWSLRRITEYDTPERIRRNANRAWGLEPEEALEMAYENVLREAKGGLRGVLPPKDKP